MNTVRQEREVTLSNKRGAIVGLMNTWGVRTIGQGHMGREPKGTKISDSEGMVGDTSARNIGYKNSSSQRRKENNS